MIIPAYNEEEVLARKLENCLGLNYPEGLIEFIIGSDGSDDATCEIAAGYARGHKQIKLAEFRSREGKVRILNKVMPVLNSDIAILSDADTMYEPDSVRNLVRHFFDPKVGGVCGRLVLVKERHESSQGEVVYWKYENYIKELESRLGTIVSINGQIFAVRRDAFEELPPDSITEDQVLGMKMIEKGYDILFEPRAICTESAGSLKSEFSRRMRISAGNFQSIARSLKVLDPRRNAFASFALFSHKILRWCVPFFLMAIFITCLLLWKTPFFKLLVFAQSVFYLSSAGLYALNKKGIDMPALEVILYFNMMNLAVLIGFWKFVTGAQKATWQKTR